MKTEARQRGIALLVAAAFMLAGGIGFLLVGGYAAGAVACFIGGFFVGVGAMYLDPPFRGWE
jgi:hypothetical protein